MPPSTRPQTLKQAKRAYRKSGGPVRLSACELAQAERRATLQERADRIRAREARRKANLKQRDERIAREREAAKKEGRPFFLDQKSGWQIGASQLSLGGYINKVQKGLNAGQEKAPSKEVEEKEEERDNIDNIVGQEQVEPAKPPMLPLVPTEPSAESSVGDALLKEDPPACSALQMPPPKPPIQQQFELLSEAFDDYFPSNTQVQRELSPEPKKCMTRFSTAILRASPTPFVQNIPTHTNTVEANDDIMACISTQDLNLSSTPTTLSKAKPAEDSDLLAQISTQDLDFDDEAASEYIPEEANAADSLVSLAQILTQDLDFSQESINALIDIEKAVMESSVEFTDDELERLAMDYDMNEHNSAFKTLGVT